MSSQVLVTGGAGFIGSHLVFQLLKQGYSVRVLDNLSTGSLENIRPVLNDLHWIEGDLRDLDTCRRACHGVDTIFHLGALGSVPRSLQDPLTTHAVNVTGTLNLLHAAREASVRRLVFSSSSSVYGNQPEPVKHEGLRPLPRSPYAVSKLAGEEYCKVFWECFGLQTVVLRYFNVFGPRQNAASQYAAVIPRFLTALSSGQQPIIYGDGLQSRDFTFVANVVQANIRACQAENVGGSVMNVASGRSIALRDVLHGAQKLLDTWTEPAYEAERAGDVRHSLADISLAGDRLGYQPLIHFEEGLSRTVSAFSSAGLSPVLQNR